MMKMRLQLHVHLDVVRRYLVVLLIVGPFFGGASATGSSSSSTSSDRIVLQRVLEDLGRIPSPAATSTMDDLRAGGHHSSCSTTAANGKQPPGANDVALERAAYIRELLWQRIQYVSSGKRERDFRKWVQQNGGQVQIYSMHGVDNQPAEEAFFRDNEPNQESTMTTATPSSAPPPTPQCWTVPADPFPSNRLDLGLLDDRTVLRHHAPPPNQFPGPPQHLIDTRPPHWSQLVWRAVALAYHFFPATSTSGLALVWPSFRRRVWYPWLADCLGASGAAWIKWGQWSATRNDMFPQALCQQLATLHSGAPAHTHAFSQRQLESSLGLAPQTLGHVFDTFDPTPLASGSIAQVHRASIHNVTLAMKIRHPRVAQLIDMDFRIMALGAQMFDWFPALRWLRVRESVEQFSRTMAAQAHLNVEGHHLEALHHNFASWSSVRYPRPYYASSSVIVESFEQGHIASEVIDYFGDLATAVNQLQLQQQQHSGNGRRQDASTTEYIVEEVEDDGSKESDVAQQSAGAIQLYQGHDLVPLDLAEYIISTGLSIYLKMLLVDNLMHADFHPGNIFVDLFRMAGGKNPSPDALEHGYQITLVDAGMVAQLTDHESSVFIGLLACLGSGDGREAGKFALQWSAENEKMPLEKRARFLDDMEVLFSKICRGYYTDVDVGEVLRGVLDCVRKHQVRIDANYATLVVNLMCLESMARKVMPGYNVLDASKPLLQPYRKLCYTKDLRPRSSVCKSKLFKAWLSHQSHKKTNYDTEIFRIEEEKRKRQDRQLLPLLK